MTRRRPHLHLLSSGDGWTLEFEHAFRAFYDRLFEPAFPDPDIRESAANLKRLSDTRLFGGREPRGFIDLAMTLQGNRSAPVGGILHELFHSADAALVTYVVVAEGWRGHGIATRLIDRARQALESERLSRVPKSGLPRVGKKLCGSRDFKQAFVGLPRNVCLRGGKPLLIFAETEKDAGSNADRVRLNALGRLGFAALDCDYIQPPLQPGKHHVPLRLLVHRPAGGAIPAARVGQFLRAFYRSILGDALASDSISQGVLAAIAARETIATQPLRTA